MKYSKTQFICCAILCIIFIGIFFHWFANQSYLEPFFNSYEASWQAYKNESISTNIQSYVNDSQDTRGELSKLHTKLLTYKVNSELGTHSIDIQSKPDDKYNVSLSCDGIMVTYPTGPTGELGPIGQAGPIGPTGPTGQIGPTGPIGPSGYATNSNY